MKQSTQDTIRLTINACANKDVVPGSPNDKARTVYTPLEGTSWNVAMAKFLVALAELEAKPEDRVRSAIVLGMRVGLARLPENDRKSAHEAMRAKLAELFPKPEAKEDTPAPKE